jgi:hypothetical protein
VACKADNACDDKFVGKMCNTCAPGLHLVLFACVECSEGAAGAVVTLFEVLVVVLLWHIVAVYTQKHDSLDVLLLYLQCLSLTQVSQPRHAPATGSAGCCCCCCRWRRSVGGLTTILAADAGVQRAVALGLERAHHLHGCVKL